MPWRKVWKKKRVGVRRDVWLLRWYDDAGRMRAKTYHGDARAADEECRRLELELNDGSLGRRRDIDWLSFCEEFLADLAARSRPRTVTDYRETLRMLTEYGQPQRISQITPSLLRNFVRARTEGRSPATRNKLVRTLRAIFRWAVPEYLKGNPALGVLFAPEPETDKRTLTPDEFFRALEGGDDRDQAVLMLGTCCGFRREEIVFLQWEDVNLERTVVRVRNTEWHTSKSGRQRTLLMPPALVQVLARMQLSSRGPFVFADVYRSYKELPNDVKREWSLRYQEGIRDGLSRVRARALAWNAVQDHQRPDRPISPDRLTDLVPRLFQKAGLRQCTLHDLRRTFCTYLAACGTDVLAAQKLAGHSSPAVTAKHYVGVVPEMLKSQEKLPFWSKDSHS
jgi:integrase